MALNYRTLADEALLHQIEVTRPHGPVHLSRTKWKALVAAGKAPQPVIRRHKGVLWRWGDIRQWLIDQAAAGHEGVEWLSDDDSAGKAGGGQ